MPRPFDPEDVRELREEIDAKSNSQRPAETPEELRERILREHNAVMGREYVPDPPTQVTMLKNEVGPSKDQEIINQVSRSGEPIFIFRAKDIFSVMAIKHYLDIVEDYGPEDLDFQEEIVERLNDFKRWQKENISKVRYPD